MSYDSTYMWNLKKRYKWTYLQNRRRLTGIKKTNFWLPKGGEGWLRRRRGGKLQRGSRRPRPGSPGAACPVASAWRGLGWAGPGWLSSPGTLPHWLFRKSQQIRKGKISPTDYSMSNNRFTFGIYPFRFPVCISMFICKLKRWIIVFILFYNLSFFI